MRVFYSTDFKGRWPVGTSAVVAAIDEDDARRRLQAELAAIGLGNQTGFTVTELSTDTPRAVILQSGDY